MNDKKGIEWVRLVEDLNKRKEDIEAALSALVNEEVVKLYNETGFTISFIHIQMEDIETSEGGRTFLVGNVTCDISI